MFKILMHKKGNTEVMSFYKRDGAGELIQPTEKIERRFETLQSAQSHLYHEYSVPLLPDGTAGSSNSINFQDFRFQIVEA